MTVSAWFLSLFDHAVRQYGATCCCLSPLQVMNGAILQQVFVVEYVIQYQMCDDCHRVEAKDFWKAVVQVRQKVGVCALIKSNLFFPLISVICCSFT